MPKRHKNTHNIVLSNVNNVILQGNTVCSGYSFTFFRSIRILILLSPRNQDAALEALASKIKHNVISLHIQMQIISIGDNSSNKNNNNRNNNYNSSIINSTTTASRQERQYLVALVRLSLNPQKLLLELKPSPTFFLTSPTHPTGSKTQ